MSEKGNLKNYITEKMKNFNANPELNELLQLFEECVSLYREIREEE